LNGSGAVDLVGTTLNISLTQPVTFGRRHHSSPYNILCAFPRGLHPNVFFPTTPTWELQNYNFYCPKVLNVHFFSSQVYFENLRAISYSPQKNLSSDVSHAPIEAHLLPTFKGFIVGNQIPNLTLAPSFDHNSCKSSLNEQCKVTLSIYALKKI